MNQHPAEPEPSRQPDGPQPVSHPPHASRHQRPGAEWPRPRFCGCNAAQATLRSPACWLETSRRRPKPRRARRSLKRVHTASIPERETRTPADGAGGAQADEPGSAVAGGREAVAPAAPGTPTSPIASAAAGVSGSAAPVEAGPPAAAEHAAVPVDPGLVAPPARRSRAFAQGLGRTRRGIVRGAVPGDLTRGYAAGGARGTASRRHTARQCHRQCTTDGRRRRGDASQDGRDAEAQTIIDAVTDATSSGETLLVATAQDVLDAIGAEVSTRRAAVDDAAVAQHEESVAAFEDARRRITSTQTDETAALTATHARERGAIADAAERSSHQVTEQVATRVQSTQSLAQQHAQRATEAGETGAASAAADLVVARQQVAGGSGGSGGDATAAAGAESLRASAATEPSRSNAPKAKRRSSFASMPSRAPQALRQQGEQIVTSLQTVAPQASTEMQSASRAASDAQDVSHERAAAALQDGTNSSLAGTRRATASVRERVRRGGRRGPREPHRRRIGRRAGDG